MNPMKLAENVTVYNFDPDIYVVEDFLSIDECNLLINAGKENLRKAEVITKDDVISSYHKGRTNSHSWIKHDANPDIHEISKRFSILAQMTIRSAEDFQLVRYEKNQEYQPHFDAFFSDTKEGAHHMKNGGQRVLTVLAYLNNVDSGGETIFPNLDISIKPHVGSVLVFENCKKNSTEPHPNSLHGGAPVISGEKWAINLWFRERLRY